MRSALRALVVLPAMSLLIVLAAVALSAMPAEAKFLPSASASTSMSSAVLNPPANLQVTTSCSQQSGSTATLSWTPTISSFATGYVRTYTMNGGASQQASGTIARTATSITFAIALKTTYTTALTSTYGSWTSQPSPPTASFICH